MDWGKYKRKAALWLGGKPSLCFLGDLRGVIVKDQLDGGVRRINGVRPGPGEFSAD
jgi:hypothetical protein